MMRQTNGTSLGQDRAVGLLAALAMALAMVGCSDALFETEHPLVEEGNSALTRGAAAEAVSAYEKAAAELPASPPLDYDQGLAKSEVGSHHQATQALIRALATKDDALLQRVRAGLGLAYSRWALQKEAAERKAGEGDPKGGAVTTPAPAPVAEPNSKGDEDAPPNWSAMDLWEKAVEQLERALLMDPSDVESMRNLEVALLRVDPPCSSRDDKNEPNNTPDKAAPIKVAAPQAAPQSQSGGGAPPPAPQAGMADELSWKGEGLLSCPDDVDFYSIELGAGDRLAVELKLDGEGDTGRLGLVLLNADGSQQLRPPVGAEEPLTAFDYSVGQAAGTYLIRVDNVDGDEIPYTLDVKVKPPCAKVEDRFEDNDSAASAALVTPGVIDGLKLCPLDEDWYKVTLGEGESLMVTVALDEQNSAKGKAPAGPAFALEIAGADGAVMAKGAAYEQTKVAALFTPGVGDFSIRVAGLPSLESRYTLTVRVVPPCDQGGDDELEDNDIVEDATNLSELLAKKAQASGGGQGQQKPPEPLSLRICPDDKDWFSVTASPDQRQQISAVFEHAKGDLVLRLFNADGTEELLVANTSSLTQNGEGLVLPEVEEETTFTFKVDGGEGVENFYQLSVTNPQPNQGDDKQDENKDDKQDENKDDKQDDKKDDKQDENKDDKQDDKKDDKQEKGDKQDKPEPGKKQPKPSRPLDDKLDKLDHNPENLEAEKAKRSSPLANHPPDKDW